MEVSRDSEPPAEGTERRYQQPEYVRATSWYCMTSISSSPCPSSVFSFSLSFSPIEALDFPFPLAGEAVVVIAVAGGRRVFTGTFIHPTVHFSVSPTSSPTGYSPPELMADVNEMCACGAGKRYEANDHSDRKYFGSRTNGDRDDSVDCRLLNEDAINRQ